MKGSPVLRFGMVFCLLATFFVSGAVALTTPIREDGNFHNDLLDVLPYNVRAYGAKGDGITDDSAAIQATLVAVGIKGGNLIFPPGRYKINTIISQTFGNNIIVKISGYGAVIDGTSAASASALITLTGSRVANSPLGGNVTKGAYTFTTAGDIGIQQHEIVLLSSTDLFNPSLPQYLKGEFATIAALSGTTYTNANPLFDSYTAATTTVHRLAMPTISIEGLEIVRNGPNIGLDIRYARNAHIHNLIVHGARYTGISCSYCVGGSFDHNYVYDSWDVTTGNSYNIIAATTQGFKILNNTLYEARHNIAAGGIEPSRDLIYGFNVCKLHPSETVAVSIDMHGNVEKSTIIGNIADGMEVTGKNVSIIGNTITESRTPNGGQTALTIFQEIDSDYYIIKDNIIHSTEYGFWYSPLRPNITVTELDISNNFIQSGTGILFQPRSSSATGVTITTLKLNGNISKSISAGALTINTSAAAFLTIKSLNSSNNIFKASAYDAVRVVNGTIINVFRSSHDEFYANRLNGTLIDVYADDITFYGPYFKGNTDGAGNSESLRYSATAGIMLVNPSFNGLTFRARIVTGTTYTEVNGTGSSVSASVINTADARLLHGYTTLGGAFSWAGAPPTTGTWAKGDVIYNIAPASGVPPAWVCTVAGTPGTWKPLANIP